MQKGSLKEIPFLTLSCDNKFCSKFDTSEARAAEKGRTFGAWVWSCDSLLMCRMVGISTDSASNCQVHNISSVESWFLHNFCNILVVEQGLLDSTGISESACLRTCTALMLSLKAPGRDVSPEGRQGSLIYCGPRAVAEFPGKR